MCKYGPPKANRKADRENSWCMGTESTVSRRGPGSPPALTGSISKSTARVLPAPNEKKCCAKKKSSRMISVSGDGRQAGQGPAGTTVSRSRASGHELVSFAYHAIQMTPQ